MKAILHTLTLNICFLTLLVLPKAVPAQAPMSLEEWERILSATDSRYIQARETLVQGLISERTKRLRWLPGLSATPGYSLSEDTQDFSLGLNLSQAIPLGGSLSASISQNLNATNFEAGNFGYRSSATLSLNQSLPSFGYAELYGVSRKAAEGTRRGSSTAVAAGEAARLRRLAGSLVELLDAAILIQRQGVGERLLSWHEKNLGSELSRFNSGLISAMDLAQAREEARSAQTIQDQRARDLVVAETTSAAWGIDIQDLDIEAWLEGLETELAHYTGPTAAEWELERDAAALRDAAGAQAEDHLSAVPALSATYSLTPAPPVAERPAPASAFRDYWTQDLSWQWNLKLSLNIPLTPWSATWSLAARAKSQATSLEAQLQDLERRRATLERTVASAKSLALDAVRRSERLLRLEEDRLELYRMRRETGALSSLDVEYQAIQVESARLDWLSARITALSTILQGD